MPDGVLERTIAGCIGGSDYPTITWHGGEPTLAGIGFFETAVELMSRYARQNKQVRNVLQTNATLITPDFAELLVQSRFELSVSLDGPATLHDRNRKSRRGKGSYKDVVRGIDNLRAAGIDPSVICTVTAGTISYAEQVFDFLVSMGFTRIRYSPVYDSATDAFSISSNLWFSYLEKVFWRWMDLANSDVSVRELDEVIAWLDKGQLPLCSSSRTCLGWVSVDPNGDLYPCEYLRQTTSYGNILAMDLTEIPGTDAYQRFVKMFLTPPAQCRQCVFYELCGNGCPATRVTGKRLTSDGVYVYCSQRRRLYNTVRRAFGE